MAWAADYGPDSDLTNMSSSQLHYQIYYAIAERQAATYSSWWKSVPQISSVAGNIYPFRIWGGTYVEPSYTSTWPPPEAEAGDSTAYTIKVFQNWVVSACSSFAQKKGAGAYDGKVDTITGYTLNQLLYEAGINPAGFTRHVPDGLGGFTTQYGMMEVGDYVCPHLWNEVKACLKLMTSVVVGNTVFTDPQPLHYGGHPQDGRASYVYNTVGYPTTFPLIKAAAQTAFNSNPGDPFFYPDYPHATSWLSWGGAAPPNDVKSGGLRRMNMKMTANGVSNTFNCTLDYYVRASSPAGGSIFNGNGDFDGKEDVWTCFEQGTAHAPGGGYAQESTNYVNSTWNTTYPTWCPDPVYGGYSEQGYYCGNGPVIAHYEGQFTYGES